VRFVLSSPVRGLRRKGSLLGVPLLTATLLGAVPGTAQADETVPGPVASVAFPAGQSTDPPVGWVTATAPDGDLVIAGTLTQPTAFGAFEVDPASPGVQTGFIAKTSADGTQVRWAHELGYVTTRPTSLAVSGGIVVALEVGGGGSSSFTGHLVAWDLASGNYRWQSYNTLGSTPYCMEPSMATAPDGSLVVTAATDRGIYTGTGWDYGTQGGCRVLVESLDAATGAARWVRILSGTNWVDSQRVAVAPDGRVVVAGYYSGTFTLGTQQVGQTGDGYSRGYLASLDADGSPLWVRPFAVSSLPQEIVAMVATADRAFVWGGDRVLSGSYPSPSRYLAALSLTDGTGVWQTALPVGFGILGVREVGALAPGPDGTLVLAAPFTGTRDVGGHVVSGSTDTWDTALVGLRTTDGRVLYADQLSGPGDDTVRSLATSGGQLLLTGLFDIDRADGVRVTRASVARYAPPLGTLGLSAPPRSEVGSDVAVALSTRSGNPIDVTVSGPCSLTWDGLGGALHPLHVGTCTVAAAQTLGADTRTAATSVGIDPLTPRVLWAPVGLTYPAPVGAGQLNARFVDAQGNDLAGSVGYSSTSGSVLPAGSYGVTASFTSASLDAADLAATRTVTVSPGLPVLSWPGTASLVYGTPLPAASVAPGYAGPISGVLGYDPGRGSGAVLDAGSYSLRVLFESHDANYRSTSALFPVFVQRATTHITASTSGTNMTAVLRDTSNNAPLAGRLVKFQGGSESCTARTDLTGAASCPITSVNPLSVVTKGFKVFYAGEKNYAPTSTQATL